LRSDTPSPRVGGFGVSVPWQVDCGFLGEGEREGGREVGKEGEVGKEIRSSKGNR